MPTASHLQVHRTGPQMAGHVVAVQESFLGSELAADAALGATSIEVADTFDFDERGGKVLLGDFDVVNYSSVDDATGILQTDALPRGWPAETKVLLFPRALERYAEVILDDSDDTEVVLARVPHGLLHLIPEGVRDPAAGDGESVQVEWDGLEWRVTDVLGKNLGWQLVSGGNNSALLGSTQTRTLPGVISHGESGTGTPDAYQAGNIRLTPPGEPDWPPGFFEIDVDENGPFTFQAFGDSIRVSGHQANGFAAVQIPATAALAGEAVGVGAVYGGVETLTNVPSSIVLFPEELHNTAGWGAALIHRRGFLFQLGPAVSGEPAWVTAETVSVGN
jgi:hypothetical protein